MSYKIEINNLTKSFGDKLVLDDVTLRVKEHEVICLIGASGSGKSTLLRAIKDLVIIDGGDILFDGISIYDNSVSTNKLNQKIGIVFQSYNLFPHINVIGNITLAPRYVYKTPRAVREKEAHRLLALFGLDDFAQSYPEQLSGGQQQRVAIIRALATHPDVLLLDEITAALDPELIADVLAVVKDLRKKGMTMLIVTHEMSFARDIADRVCFLDGGKIIEQAPAKTLFSKPQKKRTRQFLQRITEAGRL